MIEFMKIMTDIVTQKVILILNWIWILKNFQKLFIDTAVHSWPTYTNTILIKIADGHCNYVISRQPRLVLFNIIYGHIGETYKDKWSL